MKTIFTWAGIAVLALIAIGFFFGDKKPLPATAVSGSEQQQAAASTSTGSKTPDAKPAAEQQVIKITAKELSKAYEENEAFADNQYKGKLLHVSGHVTGIKKDITDSTVVELAGQNEFLPVHASLAGEEEQKAIKLKKGAKVTLQCNGGGEVATMPMLKDCSLL